MNAFQTWLSESSDRWTDESLPAVLSPWWPLGEIGVTGRSLEVVDFWACWTGCGPSVPVEPGRFLSSARAAIFGSHYRVAAIRLIRDDCPTAFRGPVVGELDVMACSVLMGPVETWLDGLPNSAVQALNESHFGRYPHGASVVDRVIGDRATRLIWSKTGIGEGGCPVYAWMDQSQVVGIECEFMPAGFRIDSTNWARP